MKNTILLIAVLVATLVFSLKPSKASTLTGESQTMFGNYSLTPSNESVVINSVAYKTWTLTYPNANKSFTVFYVKGIDDCCNFIVRNEKFEIQYSKKDGRFGVKLVDTEMRNLKKKEVLDQIDYSKFVSQQVLTSNKKTQDEYLGLIACFMPLLLSQN
jgi:hypothetical protein